MNFYTERGNLSSPNYPGQTNHREECDYHVKIATASSIRFILIFYDTEEFKDVLLVGPGPLIDFDLTDIVQLEGNLTDLPLEDRTIVFNTSQVWFNWFTDKNILSNGFFISWDAGKYEFIFMIIRYTFILYLRN